MPGSDHQDSCSGNCMTMNLGANLDIAALFESNEADRFNLHTRRLNEQMVRVLQDHWLRRRLLQGKRPVSLRSRRQPLSRSAERLRRVRGRAQPSGDAPGAEERARRRSARISCRWMSRRWPACWRSACSHTCRIWTRCSSATPAPSAVEAAIKFARGATGRSGIVYCSHGVPRPDLWRAVAQRR